MLRLALAALLLAITMVPANSANNEMVTGIAAATGPFTVSVYKRFDGVHQSETKHITLDGIKAKGDPQVTQAVLESMVRKFTGQTVSTVTCLLTLGDEAKRDLGRGRRLYETGRCWVDGQDLAARLIELGVAEAAK